MISQAAEYSLRAVLCLAQSPHEAMTAAELSERAQVPPGYFAKVLQVLSRAGIVEGRRGLRGGFCLARPIDEISLWDVIRVVDPSHRIKTCPLHLPEHKDELCPLHKRLDAAAEAVESILGAATFQQLLKDEERQAGGPTPCQCLTAAKVAEEIVP
jgi:Rrf2 family protein